VGCEFPFGRGGGAGAAFPLGSAEEELTGGPGNAVDGCTDRALLGGTVAPFSTLSVGCEFPFGRGGGAGAAFPLSSAEDELTGGPGNAVDGCTDRALLGGAVGSLSEGAGR